MNNMLFFLLILVCVALIAFVMLQQGKGEGGGMFGGMQGGAQSVFGSKGAGNFLSQSTQVLAAAFFIIILLMVRQNNILTHQAPMSDLEKMILQQQEKEKSSS